MFLLQVLVVEINYYNKNYNYKNPELLIVLGMVYFNDELLIYFSGF